MNKHDEMRTQSITDNIMKRIESGETTMRPRWQFALLTVMSAIGVAAITTLAVYVTNLLVFKLRIVSSDRPMRGIRANVDYFASQFPWVVFVLSTVSISLLIWLIRKYDFSYRLGRWLLIAVVLASLTAGSVLAFTRLNNRLDTFGPMRDIYGPQVRNSQGHNKQTMERPKRNDDSMMQHRN